MSVWRAVAEVNLDGLSVSAFCCEHGISRDRFYEFRRCFETEGRYSSTEQSLRETGTY